MDTVKIQKKGQAKIIAHRGTRLETENTAGAFIASCNRSYYGIETDVHRTADGKYIIYHDDETVRLTEKNVKVEDSDFNDLRSLKFKANDGRIIRKDIVMPSLEEYLDICKNYGKICVIELKNNMSVSSIKEICGIAEKIGYLDRIIFISFFFQNLKILRNLYPNQKIQFLVDASEEGIMQRLERVQFDISQELSDGKDAVKYMLDKLRQFKMDVDVWDKSVTKEFIDDCHSRDIKVNIFTVNDPAEAEEFIALGADYITTDILE